MLNLTVPLEDELGDVLEKAMRRQGLSEEALAHRTGVPSSRILDAIDYRSDLSSDELRRLADALELNEVGLCALGCGHYPSPEMISLPFCVHALRTPHGIGFANAYLVTDGPSSQGILFDCGPDFEALTLGWPRSVKKVDAVFVTHVEPEHSGGLCEVVARFGVSRAYCPTGADAPCGQEMGEGQRMKLGGFEVRAFGTPGHASAHNCYLVTAPAIKERGSLLISGDLVFAGSVGGAYFCHRQLATHLRRVLEGVPPETVIAPGHGPLTTARNELRYNPFVI
ncbi:MAG: beta-lactamase domain protein [Verrucomicrobia bacterium]|nr:beta-lactamase domain protein [Verrucomicrobiota bacterium]